MLTGLVGFGAWLGTGGGNRWLERRLEGLVAGATEGGRFEIGRLRLGRDGIALDEVVLADASGRPLVQVGRLVAEVDWSLLLQRHVAIPHLRAESVVVEVTADEAGVLDLQRLFGGPSEQTSDQPFELPVAIYAPDVEIVGASFRYATPEGTAFELAGVDLRGAVGGAGDRIALTSIDGTAQIAVPGPVAVRLGGALAWDGSDGVSFTELEVTVPHGLAAVNGRIGADVWDLGVRIDRLEARALDPFAGDSGIGGVWNGSASLVGPRDALKVTAAMRGVERSEGALALAATLDLTAAETTWDATVQLADFHVEHLYTPLEAPVVLDGVIAARGTGLAFPDGVTAEGTWKAGPMVLYGQETERLDAAFALSNGALLVRDTEVDGIVGTLGLEGRVDLASGGVEIDVEGRLDPERLAALGATGLDGDGTLVAQVRTIPGAGGTVTRVDGTVRYAPFVYGADVRIDRLTAGFSVTVAGGNLRGTTDLRGAGASLYGLSAATLEADGLAFARGADGRVTAEGTVDLAPIAFGEQVTAGIASTAFVFAQEEASRTVDAAIGLTDYTLLGRPGTNGQVAVHLVDDDVTFGVDLLDYGRLVLDTDGSFRLPTGELRIDRFAFAPTPRTTWTNDRPWTMRFVAGGVTDARIAAASDLGRVELRGTLATAGPLDATVAVEGFQLDHVAELYPDQADGLAGALDLDLRLAGTAEAPVVDGEVDLRGLFAAESVRWVDVKGPFRIADAVFAPELAVAVAGEPLAVVTGSVPLTGGLAAPGLDAATPATVRVDVVPGPLERFARVSPALDETPLPLGRTSAAVVLEGPLSDPRVRVAGVAELSVPGWSRPGRVEFVADRQGEALHLSTDLREGLDLRANVGGGGRTRMGEVFAAATGAGPEVDTGNAEVWLADMTLSTVLLGLPVSRLAAMGDAPVVAGGDLVGGFVVTGSPTRPVVEGALQWIDPSIGGQPLEGAYFEWVPAENGYTTQLSLAFPDGGAVEAKGAVPLVVDLDREWRDWSTGPLDVTIGGSGLPISILTGVVPGIARAEGRLLVEGRIGGTIADPKPEIGVTGDDLSLVYAPSGLEATDLFLRVVGDAEGIGWEAAWEAHPARASAGAAIEREIAAVASEVTGTPRVRATGDVRLDAWAPTTVEAEVELRDGAWVLASDTEVLRLSGDVAVDGTWPDLAVRGAVEVDQGRLEPTAVLAGATPLELSPALQVIRPGAAAEAAPEEPPLYADFDVDVTVDLKRNLELELSIPFVDDLGAFGAAVSRADLSARLGGELRVTMEGGEPALVGEVDLLDGSVRLLQSTFELVEGSTITWAGGDPYEDANLDIQAEMQVTGATLGARITGTPPEPEFELSSEEYPDPTQQMTILLTGRTPDELTAEQGAGAAGALLGLAASSLFSGVNLGSFSIEPDGSVRVAIPVTPTLLAQTTLAPTNADPNTNSLTFQVEWSAIPQVVVSGAVGDRVSSGDVFWELRF